MYKNKYLKYKKKYLDSKLQYGGNDKWLNNAVQSFGINFVLETLHKFFSHYNYLNINRLSIGSGNAFLEYSYKLKYPTEPDIICIDPFPLSFKNNDLADPFIKPSYPTAVEFNKKNPGAETVLLINWSGPDPENTYDIDAIKLLKPVAFFVIYAVRNYDSMLSLHVGSDELISFLKKLAEIRIVKLGDQEYMKISEWEGEGSPFRLGWYINWTKHMDKTQPNYYLSGEIWKHPLRDYTVKLVSDPFSTLFSGKTALSSSSASDSFLSGIATDPSINSFNDFFKTLDPINGLTLDRYGVKIDESTKLYQKSGAVIINGPRNGNTGFIIILRKNNKVSLSDDEARAVGMEKNFQIIPRDKIREFLTNLVNQT